MSIFSIARKIITPVVKHIPPLRKLARHAVRSRRMRVYRKIKSQTPTEPKTVIFESFHGRQYSDSPMAIYRQMLSDKRFDDYTFIWVFRPDKIDQLKNNPELRRAQIVVTGGREYYRSYARAGVWISNSRLHNYLEPSADQRCLQTWHGTALKKLGYDIDSTTGNAMYTKSELRVKNDEDTARYWGLISPSLFMDQVYQTAFRVGAINPACKILTVGFPRNDYLVHLARDRKFAHSQMAGIKDRLHIPSDRQVILYAPTWRDNQHRANVGYVYRPEIDFDLLQKRFGETHVILFRPHYFIANKFDFSRYDGFVYNASKIDDVNELYAISDILITDYSSVFVDYSNLGRPIIFYMYDLEQYRDQMHGFYMDLAELPGPIVRTSDQVADLIKNPPKIDARYHEFIKKYCPHDDGRASERVIEEIVR